MVEAEVWEEDLISNRARDELFVKGWGRERWVFPCWDALEIGSRILNAATHLVEESLVSSLVVPKLRLGNKKLQ